MHECSLFSVDEGDVVFETDLKPAQRKGLTYPKDEDDTMVVSAID